MTKRKKDGRYSKKGDQLEVKLRDEGYNKIYENEVSTKDIKKLSGLMDDLRRKGVDIDKAVSKSGEDYLEDREGW